MNKKLYPKNDRILLKPIEEGEQTYGSIVIPDMGKEKPEMGEVIAVGPGRLSEYGKNIPVRTCREGDIILVPKIGTLRIDFEGQEYYIAQDKEVLAVIKEVEPEAKSTVDPEYYD
jgi:chaperonin GroES|tara:strand:+ start:188 stop:532 length:345 start_codon:yes stop_codon:yes gene_type:complete